MYRVVIQQSVGELAQIVACKASIPGLNELQHNLKNLNL